MGLKGKAADAHPVVPCMRVPWLWQTLEDQGNWRRNWPPEGHTDVSTYCSSSELEPIDIHYLYSNCLGKAEFRLHEPQRLPVTTPNPAKHYKMTSVGSRRKRPARKHEGYELSLPL